MLVELWRLYADKLLLWSHQALNYNDNLSGIPDYMVAQRSARGKVILEKPYLIIVEAKKDIPDLIIEVIFTSGNIKILEIYKRIAIPEVWVWEDGLLKIYTLKNYEYNQVNQSQLLPELDIQVFTQYINYHDQYDGVTEFINYLKTQ